MPRDANGNYTLPAGNPVVAGTVIAATWANPTMQDLANEITNSLSRDGEGGMLVPFQNIDGTVGAPGVTWTNETKTGLYRAGTNDQRCAVNAVDVQRWNASGSQLWSVADSEWDAIITTKGETLTGQLKGIDAVDPEDLTTKNYVDSNSFNGGGDMLGDGRVLNIIQATANTTFFERFTTSNQAVIFDIGINGSNVPYMDTYGNGVTISGLVSSSSAPTAGNNLTNKTYVDGVLLTKIQELEAKLALAGVAGF